MATAAPEGISESAEGIDVGIARFKRPIFGACSPDQALVVTERQLLQPSVLPATTQITQPGYNWCILLPAAFTVQLGWG